MIDVHGLAKIHGYGQSSQAQRPLVTLTGLSEVEPGRAN